ncbi:MAG: hypothetical protein KIT14_18265 [bacterium]|nr:hypothetical protein [bacterium]
MRFGIVMLGGALLLATASAQAADVNCKQVMKYLQTGRSAQDVAETMVISEADVKNCQEQAAEAAGAAGGEKKDAEGAHEGH